MSADQSKPEISSSASCLPPIGSHCSEKEFTVAGGLGFELPRDPAHRNSFWGLLGLASRRADRAPSAAFRSDRPTHLDYILKRGLYSDSSRLTRGAFRRRSQGADRGRWPGWGATRTPLAGQPKPYGPGAPAARHRRFRAMRPMWLPATRAHSRPP